MCWPTPRLSPTPGAALNQRYARRSASVKSSHHGSRTSSSEPFVRAVDPSVAVFSVQRDSRFGHPHPTVVERYKALGIHLFRTDEHGAISVRTDGQSLWVEPHAGKLAALFVPATHHLAERLMPPSPASR